MEGTFKGLVKGREFGFIVPEDGSKDVWVHKDDLKNLPTAALGTRLSFDIIKTEKGPKATSVKKGLSRIAKQSQGHVKFWLDNGFGVIEPADGSEDITVNSNALPESENGYLCEGYIVDFTAREGSKGLWASDVNVVGWEKPNDPLLAFADMGSPKWWPQTLAELAEDEPWEYKNTENKDTLPILRNYFRHTFARLKEMRDGIVFSENDSYASINTGLVTDNQEEIYALFTRNKQPRQDWVLSGFPKASARKFVDNFGGSPPPLASYYEDPSVLIYDRRCELFIDIDHVMQNIGRFPKHLQDNPYVARQLLISAEALTKKRVYRNYKAAIPQFFRDKGKDGSVQLLLPICLENPRKADLALVAGKSESKAYRCSTILTLDMAYNNARLLARPDSEWLQP